MRWGCFEGQRSTVRPICGVQLKDRIGDMDLNEVIDQLAMANSM